MDTPSGYILSRVGNVKAVESKRDEENDGAVMCRGYDLMTSENDDVVSKADTIAYWSTTMLCSTALLLSVSTCMRSVKLLGRASV